MGAMGVIPTCDLADATCTPQGREVLVGGARARAAAARDGGGDRLLHAGGPDGEREPDREARGVRALSPRGGRRDAPRGAGARGAQGDRGLRADECIGKRIGGLSRRRTPWLAQYPRPVASRPSLSLVRGVRPRVRALEPAAGSLDDALRRPRRGASRPRSPIAQRLGHAAPVTPDSPGAFRALARPSHRDRRRLRRRRPARVEGRLDPGLAAVLEDAPDHDRVRDPRDPSCPPCICLQASIPPWPSPPPRPTDTTDSRRYPALGSAFVAATGRSKYASYWTTAATISSGSAYP